MKEKTIEYLFGEHRAMMQFPDLIGEVWKEKLEGFAVVATKPANQDEWAKCFLQHRLVMETMFIHQPGGLLDHQLTLIKKYLPESVWNKLLPEPNVGGGPTASSSAHPDLTFSYTHNNAHHLYHISRYVKKLGWERWSSTKSFLEWGGGYGNLARLIKTMNPDATYTIVDLPIMLLIQYRYLTETLGVDAVNVVGSDSEELVEGKVNLVCSTRWWELNQKTPIKAEMMISTWALSECPIGVQHAVISNGWFGSTKSLFSFHQCGDHIPFMEESTYLKKHLEENGNMIDDVIVIPGKNFYAFK